MYMKLQIWLRSYQKEFFHSNGIIILVLVCSTVFYGSKISSYSALTVVGAFLQLRRILGMICQKARNAAFLNKQEMECFCPSALSGDSKVICLKMKVIPLSEGFYSLTLSTSFYYTGFEF